jgi:uncharacterized phiE125 gp8 family phage protein
VTLRLIAPPATEPVSLTEAKLHLKVDGSTDDALIAALISAARMLCEAYQGRGYITQTWELTLDAFPESPFELPVAPLATITSIKYRDTAGTETTLSASDYVLDLSAEPGRVALADGKSWPSVSLYPVGGVKIRYTVGGESAPANVKQAILLTVGGWYEDRQAGSDLSPAAKALLTVDRVF